MGCGGSVAETFEPKVVEEADPLQELLIKIAEARKELQAAENEQTNAEGRLRYNSTAALKLDMLTDMMNTDLEDEQEVYEVFKRHIAGQDAWEMHEACDGMGTDEEKMSKVIVGRLPETLKITDQIYQKQYGRTVEDQIRGENKTLLGLMTGTMTNFGKFLTYRCMPEARRDAFLLHKAMNGMGTSDFILVEILSTRTNVQLQAAAAAYAEANDGEDMVERIKKETGGMGKKWYGLWIDTLVEFDRNEGEGVVGDVAELAEALYDAGESKWMGCDEQPFIDILCKANGETCKAICDAYDELEDSKKTLLQAVEDKMGGDLEFAVLARLRSREEFFAYRIYKACKGWGTDEECIGRVVSCMTKAEAQATEVHYNEFYKEEDGNFADLRKLLASELGGSFLESMFGLIDIAGPKGHSVHEENYPLEAQRMAKFFSEQVVEKYSDPTAQQLGKGPLEGPLMLCGMEDIFICGGYADYEMPASRPVFVHPDRAHLLEGQPTEVEEAEKLLKDVQVETKVVDGFRESAERDYAACRDTVVPERSQRLKYLDHFLDQMLKDNGCMMEFCASRDADFVHEAVEGWGTDEDKLIRVLCALPKKQLQRVDQIYEERYEKSLRQVTDSELGGMFEGDFKYFMKCVLTKNVELDAELLKESMVGWGTNDGLLCELLCTRSNGELKAAKAILGEESLKDMVEGDTSGGYQALLIACMRAQRDESLGKADEAAAELQATQLHDAGFGGGDQDPQVIVDILSQASVARVEAIKSSYETQYGTPMAEAIKESMGGDWEKALLARCYDKNTYYATTLEGAFKGWGTDERAISRILGRSSKPEIKRIANRYQQLYGRTLKDAIESEVSGNFKKALLCMLFAESPGGEVEGEE